MHDERSHNNRPPYHKQPTNFENYRREKVDGFHLNISEDDLDNEDVYSSGSRSNAAPVINSYSTPPSQHSSPTQQEIQAEKQAEKAHKLRSKIKGTKNKRLFRWVWIVMIIFVSIALSQYLLGGLNDLLAIGRPKVTVTVEIPKNATTKQIADILYNNSVIQKTNFFEMYAKVTKADGNYGHGTYKIETNMDYEQLINTLQSNKNRVDTVKITFPEGMNIIEIANMLQKNGVCDAKDLMEIAKSNKLDNYDLVKAVTNASDRYYKVEGYLFPDTYDFYKDEDPQTVLGKMINDTGKRLTKSIREKISKSGMSIDQTLTLASLIQAEASNEEDMYMVSSVLHNRLEKGTQNGTAQLGCDSTIFYPYRKKSSVPSDIRETFTSKYDTYKITGLPAGPICSPGLKAIDAALDPKQTNYYYFCHDKDKKAYYAKTAAEHKRNLKKAGLID